MESFLSFIASALLFGGIIFAIWFTIWYLSYKDCLSYLLNYGYDPVECLRFSEIVLKPALKRYRRACAEKLGMRNKIEKLKF